MNEEESRLLHEAVNARRWGASHIERGLLADLVARHIDHPYCYDRLAGLLATDGSSAAAVDVCDTYLRDPEHRQGRRAIERRRRILRA